MNSAADLHAHTLLQLDELVRRRAMVAPFKGATASARSYAVVVEPVAARKPAVQALVRWLCEQALKMQAR